jgi:hypothetical protein
MSFSISFFCSAFPSSPLALIVVDRPPEVDVLQGDGELGLGRPRLGQLMTRRSSCSIWPGLIMRLAVEPRARWQPLSAAR